MIFYKNANVVLESAFFLIGIFVFAMMILFGGKLINDVFPDVYQDVTMNESKAVLTEIQTRYPSVMDSLIMILFAGLWVAGIVAGMMSDQHPLIFGFLMFLMLAVLVIAGIFSNFFTDFFADPEYGSLSTSFPMTVWLLGHLVQVTVVITLSMIFALVAKNRR